MRASAGAPSGEDPTESSGGASAGGAGSGTGAQFNGNFTEDEPDPLSADAACAATSQMAEEVVTTVEVEVEVPVEEIIEVPVEVTVTTYLPFDMYIMFDQSGSMDDDTPVGTKWTAVESALTAFLNDPGSDGIGVGIQYFPFVDPAAPGFCCEAPSCLFQAPCGTFGPCVDLIPGIAGGYCEGADSCFPIQYATPDVPIEPIPAVVPKITASLNAHGPGGGTPTRPALEGALSYAIPWAAAHPDRETIVLLATDGNPSGCSTNGVQDVANIAATGLAATPPVRTFVIGVGSSLTSLNTIAAAGGSNQAILVDATSGDPTQQFIDAMNQIRDAVTTTETHTETRIETHTETRIETRTEIETTPVDCEWEVPVPPEGETFDKALVNVEFSQSGGAVQRVGYVDSPGACSGTEGGWYYDDAADPSRILVCDQTCTVIKNISGARVDILLGCETEEAILK